MDDASLTLLRSSFASIKSRFQAVDNPHSPYRAWLVHTQNGSHPDCSLIDGFEGGSGNWRYVGVPVSRANQRTMCVDRTGAVEIPGGRTLGFQRMVQVEGWNIFKPLVGDAAQLMHQMPVAIQQKLWANLPERAEVNRDSLAWVAAVFELAWQAPVSSPLGATKSGIPFYETPVNFKFGELTDWYSTLDNFAVASAQAIDILLNWLDASAIKPDATSPEGAAQPNDTAAMSPAEAGGQPAKRKRGRPKGAVANDPKEDQRLAEAWATGQHASKEELARAKGIAPAEVHAALDRHRKRLAKPESIRPEKHRQGQ